MRLPFGESVRSAKCAVLFAVLVVLLETQAVLPQSTQQPGSAERVIKCSEQKDAARARKLAIKQMENGKLDKAEGCARAVLRIRGDTASAADWEQLGIILNRRGKMQGAVNALRNAVARDDHVKPTAEVRVERRLELANSLLGIGRPEDAMEQYRECAMIAPHMPGPYINGGNVHLHGGNYPAAEHFYRTALQLDPANFDAVVNLGALMSSTSRGELAVKEYRRALALDPGNVDALSNLGSLQMDMGDVKGGLLTFKEALKVNDERAPLSYNIANAYLANGQVQEAMDKYQRAIELDPSMLSAKCSVASMLAMTGRFSEAKSLVNQAAQVSTGSLTGGGSSDEMWRLTAKCLLAVLKVETSEWGAYTREQMHKFSAAFISDILASSLRTTRKEAENLSEDNDEERKMRLRAMSLCLDPSRALYLHGMDHHQSLIAAIYYWQQAQQRAKALPRLVPTSTPLFWQPDTKLGVGYVFVGQESNVESLMDMLFLARHSTAHDGRRVAHCYSLRSDVENALYLEIKLLCGKRFHDVSALSHSQAAKQINADGIHILVDTVGHAYGRRGEVLAMQPSAIQVEVKPMRTMGSPRVFVSDRIVTPPEYLAPRPGAVTQLINAAALGVLDDAMSYTEGVIMLPHRLSWSFSTRHHHSNLHDLPVRTWPQFRRRQLLTQFSLPTDKMMYAYASRLHAVTDDSLEAWISILKQVPNAVLLLPDHPPGARESVEGRAISMGLLDAKSRLIFQADIAMNDTARCQVLSAVDLVLDTPAPSVGAAAAQALLVSAPVITLAQRPLHSRTAASQILAAYPESGGPPLLEDHAPHLVARNIEDFVDLAVRVGQLQLAAAARADDWVPFVNYQDVREHLLLHDGAWWHKYNTGMRMVWEAHLVLYLADEDNEDASLRPFPSSRRLPHIIVA